VNKRVVAIATASRHKGPEGEEKRKKQYRELLRLSRQILNDAKRVIGEVEQMRRHNKRLRHLSEGLATMAVRVRQVVKQAKARVFEGVTQLPGKIVSLFQPHTEIIRKGKASKPTEFGKLVQLQEAENQIITHYDVFDQLPSDRELLLGAVEAHEQRLGRVPELAAADAGYYSQAQERAVEEKRVKRVAVPNCNGSRSSPPMFSRQFSLNFSRSLRFWQTPVRDRILTCAGTNVVSQLWQARKPTGCAVRGCLERRHGTTRRKRAQSRSVLPATHCLAQSIEPELPGVLPVIGIATLVTFSSFGGSQ
jgi:IS5 family transposase